VKGIRERLREARTAWRVALEQDLRPSRFAYAFACGIFIATGPVPPVLFMRSGAVIAFAWIARANRLVAFLTSHVILLPIWVALIIYEVRLGARILGKTAPPWRRDLPLLGNVREIAKHALPSALLGGVLVALAISAVAYAICFVLVARLQRRRRADAAEAAATSGQRA